MIKKMETTLERSGVSVVGIQEMKNDFADIADALEKDKFLADMEKNSAEKTTLFEENATCKTEELAGLADAICPCKRVAFACALPLLRWHVSACCAVVRECVFSVCMNSYQV